MNGNGIKNLLKSLKLNEGLLSRFFGFVVIAVVGILLFNYFKGVGEEPVTPEVAPEEVKEVKLVEEEGKLVPEGTPRQYTVQEGDHLWKIAEEFYGSGYNWIDIAQANKLENPDRLAEGQKLTLPKTEVREQTTTQEESPKPITGTNYKIQKGDYLWEIAVRAYGDGYKWVEIAQANNLENPDVIHEGNTLILPR